MKTIKFGKMKKITIKSGTIYIEPCYRLNLKSETGSEEKKNIFVSRVKELVNSDMIDGNELTVQTNKDGTLVTIRYPMNTFSKILEKGFIDKYKELFGDNITSKVSREVAISDSSANDIIILASSTVIDKNDGRSNLLVCDIDLAKGDIANINKSGLFGQLVVINNDKIYVPINRDVNIFMHTIGKTAKTHKIYAKLFSTYSEISGKLITGIGVDVTTKEFDDANFVCSYIEEQVSSITKISKCIVENDIGSLDEVVFSKMETVNIEVDTTTEYEESETDEVEEQPTNVDSEEVENQSVDTEETESTDEDDSSTVLIGN